jgi:hypothetical protein
MVACGGCFLFQVKPRRISVLQTVPICRSFSLEFGVTLSFFMLACQVPYYYTKTECFNTENPTAGSHGRSLLGWLHSNSAQE